MTTMNRKKKQSWKVRRRQSERHCKVLKMSLSAYFLNLIQAVCITISIFICKKERYKLHYNAEQKHFPKQLNSSKIGTEHIYVADIRENFLHKSW